MKNTRYLSRTSTWRKQLILSLSVRNSKFFQAPNTSNKAARTLDQIINFKLPEKENIPQFESKKAKTRAFKKVETKMEKNTKRLSPGNKILLKKIQKQDKPWSLRESIVMIEYSKPKTPNVCKTPQNFQFQLKTDKHQNNHNFKRIADYKMSTLQQKCPFTRYQIYSLFSTFNAIISDSIKFEGTQLSFSSLKFINDVATMLKVQAQIVKRVFLLQAKKKYYATNKSFQFLDFLTLVDHVRKQSLRQKINDYLNIIFNVQNDSLGYDALISLFGSKSNQRQCQQFVTKLFNTLMKTNIQSINKQQLMQLFDINENMLEMFRKIARL